MIEHRYIRQIDVDTWQWRIADEQGQWQTDEVHSGSFDTFLASLTGTTTPIHIVVAGEQVITTHANSAGLDKKHLAKLLPYELEDQLAQPVEHMHMVFSVADDTRAIAHYIDNKNMTAILQPFVAHNLEVVEVLPDYRLLQTAPGTLTLMREDEKLMVCNGEAIGFTTETTLAPFVLQQITQDHDVDFSNIVCVAANDEAHEYFDQTLPATWQEQCELKYIVGDFWSYASAQTPTKQLNLRRGRFAKQLPFGRWLHWWQWPMGVMAVAFVFAIGLMVIQTSTYKAQVQTLRQQIQEVYLEAVPGGRKGDELYKMRGLVSKNKTTGAEPSNVMTILSRTAIVIKDMPTVQMANFRYTGSQRSLQVNIEVANLAELNDFKNKLAQAGLDVDSPRSSAKGDIYQARMTLKEAN